MTDEKKFRNKIYTVCGLAILGSLAAILAAWIFDPPAILGVFQWPLVFETTSLLAFGFAWLVKGETLFTDKISTPQPHPVTSNRLFTLAARPVTNPTQQN